MAGRCPWLLSGLDGDWGAGVKRWADVPGCCQVWMVIGERV